jgi:hypothetical protein
MLFVQIAKRHRVGKELVEILDALLADARGQRDRKPDEVAVRLDLVRLLMGQWFRLLQDGVRVDELFRHVIPSVYCRSA